MKLKISSILLLAVVVLFSAFTSVSKIDIYNVDASKSVVTWKGGKITGSSHNGTVKIKSGKLSLDGNKLKGGTFTMDMNTIKDADGSERLEGHLKNDDFFATDKFPAADLKITKITGNGSKVKIDGNLTIKGITKPVSFDANINVNKDGSLTASADKIIVNRAKYDIKYNSSSFFSSLGDKAINDDFELTVKLVAKK